MVNWKDHCNIKPTHYDPRLFITSQWQLDRDSPSIIYLLLRVSIFLAFLVIAILTYILETEDGQKTWGIYLTNWGLSICTIQAFFSFSMLFYAVIAHYLFEKGKLVKFVSNLYWLYWMVSTIAIPLAFTISLIYWTFLYQGRYKNSFSGQIEKKNFVYSGILVNNELYGPRNEFDPNVYRFVLGGASCTFNTLCIPCGIFSNLPHLYLYLLYLWRYSKVGIGNVINSFIKPK